MQYFLEKSANVIFINANFDETMDAAKKGDVIYCDPPYAPLSKTAYFTDYHVGGFNWEDQIMLADLAREKAAKGIRVIISNHDTREIRKLYSGAKFSYFKVQRNISCNGAKRQKANELLALFDS